MYTLHTVNYSNPSAIEGAIRDATTSEEAKVKKQEEVQKIRHEVRNIFEIIKNCSQLSTV